MEEDAEIEANDDEDQDEETDEEDQDEALGDFKKAKWADIKEGIEVTDALEENKTGAASTIIASDTTETAPVEKKQAEESPKEATGAIQVPFVEEKKPASTSIISDTS